MIDRWPAIAAIALALTGLIIADQRVREEPLVVDAPAPELMPVISGDDELGSTWYCPGGLVAADGRLNHIVIVTNPSDDDAAGRLTLYPSIPDGQGATVEQEPIEQPIEVPAGAQLRVALDALLPVEGDLVSVPEVHLAALLEFGQAGVLVEHSLITPTGTDLGACASTTARTWHLASGTTRGDTRQLVSILNPFPGPASVDIWFPTDTGVRRPTAYTGLVLPARSVTVLDVGSQVPTRAQMAMTVEARSGRVVVERVQLFTDADGPIGATLSLGAPLPTEQWFFPAGRAAPDQAESYVIYNPNDTDADLEVEIQFDDTDAPTIIQPLTVGAGERLVVYLDESDSHPVSDVATLRLASQLPDSGQYWVSIRGFNEVGVVAERLTSASAAAATGATAVLGAPLTGTTLHVAIPVVEVPDAVPELVLLNPAGDTLAQATVSALVGGSTVDLLDLEIGPRRRAVANLASILPPGAVSIEVTSTQGLVAELNLTGPTGSIASMGVPTVDGAAVPRLFAF